jgi:hypothetical protein
LILALALTLSAPANARWHPGMRSAIRYVRERLGQVRFEVRTADHKWGLHTKSTVPSASVLKAGASLDS